MTLRLFEGYGIELEYMIVDRETLDVRPLADAILPESEVERGALAWSNELALHLLELKTNGPAPRLAGLAAHFQAAVREIDAQLAPRGARLMPTGMHPWMDPARELVLWPHQHGSVYEALDRIFDCRGHGWANLQSVHLNLPFADDEEFGRLHAAVRLALPILPALAASSPLVEGRLSGLLDSRLEFYRTNAADVPSVSGLVVPEPLFTRADYEKHVLERIYADLAPRDPAGALRHEWVNARGAIARFDRGAIEIRVLDVQEHPTADLAVAAAATALVRALAEGRLASEAEQRAFPTETLAAILAETTRDAESAWIRDEVYLRALGWPAAGPARAGELWAHGLERWLPERAEWGAALDVLLEEGSLARRIATRLGPRPPRARLHEIYADLCECLAAGRSFRARA